MPSFTLKGVPAASGLARGVAFVKVEEHPLSIPRYACDQPDVEKLRLTRALDIAGQELERLRVKLDEEGNPSESLIFEAHSMFLEDPDLLAVVDDAIRQGGNAEAAWMDGVEMYAQQLEQIRDATLSARAVDVRDVGRRVLRNLLGIPPADEVYLADPSIIVARDLTPSQTASLDKTRVLGFCLAEGGPSGHTAILARGLGLPAVVGMGNISKIETGMILVLNGDNGEVTCSPDEEYMHKIELDISRRKEHDQALFDCSHLPAVTLDGTVVEVVANIGSPDEAARALEYGAEGVGLFRTEFLFLNRAAAPGREEQAAEYRRIFEVMAGCPIVARLLDIGGDKEVPYLAGPKETNPFLGWRAVRMLDERPDLYEQQLLALLEAAADPAVNETVDLRIMVPMISSLEEVRFVRTMMDRLSEQAWADRIPPRNPVQFGIMVEIPSAAILADRIALDVDFFSIGTNDLTQYTLAVDRSNARVSKLASPFHPAVLNLIDLTIRAAHAAGKWVGLCGEFAGEPLAAPLLLGLGLDEFSMAGSRIPSIKHLLRSLDVNECRRLSEEALKLRTAGEVMELVRRQIPQAISG